MAEGNIPVTPGDVVCWKSGWVGLVAILKRLEDEPFHWPVGRVRFQKIAYFAQHQGLSVRFEFKQDELSINLYRIQEPAESSAR